MKFVKLLLFFVIMGAGSGLWGMDEKKGPVEDIKKQITEFSLDSIIPTEQPKQSTVTSFSNILKQDLSTEEQLKLYGFNLSHLKPNNSKLPPVRSMIPTGNSGMNNEMNSILGNQIFIPVMQAVNNNLAQGLEDAQKNIQQNMGQQITTILDKKVGNPGFNGWVGQTIGTVTSSGTSMCSSAIGSVASIITLVGCYALFKYVGGAA